MAAKTPRKSLSLSSRRRATTAAPPRAGASRPPMERIMRLHQRINSGRFPNCRSLAEELEVSTRTILRDLEFMRDRLEYPIEYDAQQFGFFYTKPVTEFPAMEVSEGEVVALLLAQKALTQYRGTGLEQPLRITCNKLMECLTDRITVNVAELDAAFSFRGAGPSVVDSEIFEPLSKAVLQSLEISFQYLKLGSTQWELRRVEPYHLGCVDNQWYCFGYDMEREQMRTFALPRMRKVRLTNTHFELPEDFSIAAHLKRSFGVFHPGEDAKIRKVRILFDAWAGTLVSERIWHESQKIKRRASGEVELTLELSGLEEVERWVLSWGEHATVLSPARLRERIRQVGKVLAER
ncbi:MAG: helix-turn-helix transcriptional regulator [Chthoniobacteraceae bacterium]